MVQTDLSEITFRDDYGSGYAYLPITGVIARKKYHNALEKEQKKAFARRAVHIPDCHDRGATSHH